MKYYVFGEPNNKNKNDNDLTFKSSSRLNIDDNNYEGAVDKFYKVDLKKYSHVFLVVDFEIVGDVSLFGYTSENNFKNGIAPFIVLEERTSIGDLLDIPYCDNLEIVTNGFNQIFNTNKEAFEKFLYFARIGKKVTINETCKLESHIISTDDLRYNKPKPIKRFKIHSRVDENIYKRIEL